MVKIYLSSKKETFPRKCRWHRTNVVNVMRRTSSGVGMDFRSRDEKKYMEAFFGADVCSKQSSKARSLEHPVWAVPWIR